MKWDFKVNYSQRNKRIVDESYMKKWIIMEMKGKRLEALYRDTTFIWIIISSLFLYYSHDTVTCQWAYSTHCAWSGHHVDTFINRSSVYWHSLLVEVWHWQHIFHYINPTGNDARCHLSLHFWQCAWHDLKRVTAVWRQIAQLTRRHSINPF